MTAHHAGDSPALGQANHQDGPPALGSMPTTDPRPIRLLGPNPTQSGLPWAHRRAAPTAARIKRRVTQVRESANTAVSRAFLAHGPTVKSTSRSPELVVSFTSFPARIEDAWIAADSLMRQDVPPDAVVLVLSQEEFPDQEVPRSLRLMQRRGLEILWVDRDLRSFKKLLPVSSVPHYPTGPIGSYRVSRSMTPDRNPSRASN